MSSRLVALPTELLVKIICYLPSFIEALPLLSTCRRLRAVLIANASTIYYHLSMDPCMQEALQLLDSREVQRVGDVKASHAFSLVRQFQRIQKAMKVFESKVLLNTRAVRRLSVPNRSTTIRPKHLTCAECVRFIRAYYQFCILVRLDADARMAYLMGLTLRRLCFLYEITMPKRHKGYGPDLSNTDARIAIHSLASDAIIEKSRKIYGGEGDQLWCAWDLECMTFRSSSYNNHVAMFDHYQSTLKNIIVDCDMGVYWPKKPAFSSEFIQEHLWDEDL